MGTRVASDADKLVKQYLEQQRSFAMIAGAGAGKTTSLVDALIYVRELAGASLKKNGQRIACITFTKRAVEVINKRLGFDDLYVVSTLHSFLWGQISKFHTDIRQALQQDRIPNLIRKAQEDDNGGTSKKAQSARGKIAQLTADLAALGAVPSFKYNDSRFSNYGEGRIGHDDIIEIAGYLLATNATFRRIVGLQFPYIFVDEAQDTFATIVEGLNLVCYGQGLPMIGYFGDPWQQIYDRSIGDFAPPNDGEVIAKRENFRCSQSVIKLLNVYRTDVEQYAAGDNKDCEGSVEFILVKSEEPTERYKRYSDSQIDRALARMDMAVERWGWATRTDVVKLFLARQMIARRLGFGELNSLFTGDFASSRAQESFESGTHYLLKPFLSTIYPLLEAKEQSNDREIIMLLLRESPAFATDGVNAGNSLSYMIETANSLIEQLRELLPTETVGNILRFCVDKQIIKPHERLLEHLTRAPRIEEFDVDLHGQDKGDWLADALFRMKPAEIAQYAEYINSNTAYSTQHGVKGEEYKKVIIVFDDVEAAWNQYSFSKLLTPLTAGEPTERQRSFTQKLAYVSFSRAEEDLRVLMFTPDPAAASKELVDKKFLRQDQISVLE